MIETTREKVENLLHPQLKPYRRNERDRLLRKAAETSLDFFEWTGILAAIIFVVAATRYSSVDFGFLDRVAVALVNFAVSLLLLGIAAGPFLVRRTRRGLRSQLD